MTKVCISFAGSSGLSGFPGFPPAAARQLQSEFPAATIVLAQSLEQRRAELTDTDVLFSVRFGPEDLAVAKQLKWLHLSSAGAAHVLFSEKIASDILLTNSPRLYRIPIAQHGIGVMVFLARQVPPPSPLHPRRKQPRQQN